MADPEVTNTTLTEVLEQLQCLGHSSNFTLVGPRLHCLGCRADTGADQTRVHALRRIEGASDPADNTAVLAVECSSCHRRGALVVRYGPEASADEATFLRGTARSVPATFEA